MHIITIKYNITTKVFTKLYITYNENVFTRNIIYEYFPLPNINSY